MVKITGVDLKPFLLCNRGLQSLRASCRFLKLHATQSKNSFNLRRLRSFSSIPPPIQQQTSFVLADPPESERQLPATSTVEALLGSAFNATQARLRQEFETASSNTASEVTDGDKDEKHHSSAASSIRRKELFDKINVGAMAGLLLVVAYVCGVLTLESEDQETDSCGNPIVYDRYGRRIDVYTGRPLPPRLI